MYIWLHSWLWHFSNWWELTRIEWWLVVKCVNHSWPWHFSLTRIKWWLADKYVKTNQDLYICITHLLQWTRMVVVGQVYCKKSSQYVLWKCIVTHWEQPVLFLVICICDLIIVVANSMPASDQITLQVTRKDGLFIL